jgi:hypothetical protein
METLRCENCTQLRSLSQEQLATLAKKNKIPVTEIKNNNGGVLRACHATNITVPEDAGPCFSHKNFTPKSS